MLLEKLISLAPPSVERFDVPTPDDFAACEGDLGLTLPADFKQLLAAYGAGRFLDYLFAYPLDGQDMNLRRNSGLLAGHSGARETYPDWYPYPLHPEPGGLLIWGGTHDAHTLCWLTEGGPDEWPVVVWQQRDSRYRQYDGGVVAFVTDWLERTLPAKTLPRVPKGAAWFEPARRLREVIVRNWRISYSEWPAGRKISIAFPAADEEDARAAILGVLPAMGHTVRHAQTGRGKRVWTR